MRSAILTIPAFALALLMISSLTRANDVEALEQKAISLKKESAEMMEQGRLAEAEKLAELSRSLMSKAKLLAERGNAATPDRDVSDDSRAMNPDIRHLKERLLDLRVAWKEAARGDASDEAIREIRAQISRTERKLAFLSAQHDASGIPPQFRAQAEKLEYAARRLQHIRVAAENLKAADMHDMARGLFQQAEAMEHDIDAAKRDLAKLIGADEATAREPQHDIQQLREEHEQLRREMQELREAVEHLRKEHEQNSRGDEKDSLPPSKL